LGLPIQTGGQTETEVFNLIDKKLKSQAAKSWKNSFREAQKYDYNYSTRIKQLFEELK
jgi:hypothetical protein